VPRLIAEEAYDNSGPIEATAGSGPIGASLLASLRPHSEMILRLALSSQYCVDLTQLGCLLFVNLTHFLSLLGLGRTLNAGDVESSFSPFVIQIRFDLSGKLDGFIWLGRSFFQHSIPDVLPETS
jgi:hypothetical protein